MNPPLFNVARWALTASFAVMVLVVCLPNPRPSEAWLIARQVRSPQRFPADSPPDAFDKPEAELQLATRPAEDASERSAADQNPAPVRTAQRPSSTSEESRRPARDFLKEEPAIRRLAPPPEQLELPSKEEAGERGASAP